MSDSKKRGRGRPPITDKHATRHEVVLPPYVADYLRASGDGSISRGIMQHIAPYIPAPQRRRHRVLETKND